MCRKEFCGAIAVPNEAHSTQRGQVRPTTENENVRAWLVEVRAKKAKSSLTPGPLSGVNCDLWCPGWDSGTVYFVRYSEQIGWASSWYLGSAGPSSAFGCPSCWGAVQVFFHHCLHA